ncbi:threonine--tRNA ligase [Filifactor villosus]|uniref:Threonine--tRNA ligase n=1 Tax=Filifactor villosus TaxID=29374 RepID=A0ABV9QRX0_9FIRM
MIQVVLKDGSKKEFEHGVKAIEVASALSEGLARSAVAAKINGEVRDLTAEVPDGANVEFLKFEDAEGKDVFWHTSTHIMAQAVKRLFPDARFGIGPALDNGYYYDIDLEHKLTAEDLEAIEKEMKNIVKEDLQIRRFELPPAEAKKLMEDRGEIYKVELIADIEDRGENISFYEQGEYVDLCSGPHLPSTKKVKAFKVMSVAGAYWRGDQANKQLQRLYGISFEKKKELDDYLNFLEEAKRRDHRKIGKELGLFTLMEEGPGFPFFLPKGTVLKNELMKYWREIHYKDGYVEIETPIILSRQLWETSGHWFHYKENMYTVQIDEQDFAIKPMNCPGCMLTYKTEMRSYKDFPIKMGEVGRVHRHELSGALHGLMRVRAFTQDDAHIFMLESQIKDEIKGVAKLIDEVYKKFGFSYHVELSTRPEDFMGEIEQWDQAEASLKEALDELGLPYIINEGDGAFYGPKIDFHLNDCIGRTWQCGTIQLDYQLPERFDLTYVGQDGEKHRPIMIHRVAFGSIERFIGILIEHYEGKFPVWLSPVQVKILPISDKYMDYCKEVYDILYSKGIRVELDDRAEKIGYKIREAQLQKIPYMLVLGEKEVQDSVISVRSRDDGELGQMKLDDFLSKIVEEIEERRNSIKKEEE